MGIEVPLKMIETPAQHYVYTYSYRDFKETRQGPVGQIAELSVTSHEYKNAIYFDVDLIVPGMSHGKFQLLSTLSQTRALEAQKEWEARLISPPNQITLGKTK